MKSLIYLIFFVSISLYSEVNLIDLKDNEIWSRQDKVNVSYFTKKDIGRVPILCFHKIGDEPRYEITAENFEVFLKYLNSNKYYVLSDKEFILENFSMVPTGYTPIVLGSDDASEGNFLYKTLGSDTVYGELDYSTGELQLEDNTMVSLLEKYIDPSNGTINFTFYISFNGIPFRQTGGEIATGDYYRGIDTIGTKFNYLLDNFIVGIHTVTHPVTKNTNASDFKWEIDEFYNILTSYVGEKTKLINTLAYPYGCLDLKSEMETMLRNYNNYGLKILGGFDFDGYFSNSPFTGSVNSYDISRLGVDNQNIQNVYGFLESVKLFNTQRVIVVESKDDLVGVKYNDSDIILVGKI